MYITDNGRSAITQSRRGEKLNNLRVSSAVNPRIYFKIYLPVAKVPINDPKHWRERAEEARTVADELTDPDAKRRMLRIANDYDELARRAEKRLRDRKNS
jgi:hypothetical protein